MITVSVLLYALTQLASKFTTIECQISKLKMRFASQLQYVMIGEEEMHSQCIVTRVQCLARRLPKSLCFVGTKRRTN